VSGIQSFVLAVDPASGQQQSNNALDGSGFLGGTVAGREFWRGSRGGGEAGAKAFKAFCHKETKDSFPGDVSQKKGSVTPAVNAGMLKADLYNEMRSALRCDLLSYREFTLSFSPYVCTCSLSSDRHLAVGPQK
jgi:hypothetical protein